MNFFDSYKENTFSAIEKLDSSKLISFTKILKKLKNNKGRMFVAGVGGSAANASHLVNDFRKLTNIECYSISENISELTARINDDGWENSYVDYLKVSNFSKKDIVLILSVGGGSIKKNVSLNLIRAIQYAKKINAKSISIVSNLGGYAKLNCDLSIIINVKNKNFITPISETLQAFIWHYLVSQDSLKVNNTKW